MHDCKDEIMFVQGDVVETYFYIEGIEQEYISNLYFSCEAEKILTSLPYSEEQEGYCFRLTSKQTSLLLPKFCTYDLTLELVDGNTMTLLHGRSFIVLKKRNTLNPEDYADEPSDEEEGNEPSNPENNTGGDNSGNGSGDGGNTGDTGDNTGNNGGENSGEGSNGENPANGGGNDESNQ